MNGTLTVNNSTISNNDASGSVGGGIANLSGTLTVNSGNTASAGGGVYSVGALSISNSAVSGNTAFDGFGNGYGGGTRGRSRNGDPYKQHHQW